MFLLDVAILMSIWQKLQHNPVDFGCIQGDDLKPFVSFSQYLLYLSMGAVAMCHILRHQHAPDQNFLHQPTCVSVCRESVSQIHRTNLFSGCCHNCRSKRTALALRLE